VCEHAAIQITYAPTVLNGKESGLGLATDFPCTRTMLWVSQLSLLSPLGITWITAIKTIEWQAMATYGLRPKSVSWAWPVS